MQGIRAKRALLFFIYHCLNFVRNMNIDNTMMNSYDFDSLFKESGEGGRFYRQFLQRVEKPLIEWSLRRAWGNQVKAAKILGLNRNTIRAKIKKLGIDPGIYK